MKPFIIELVQHEHLQNVKMKQPASERQAEQLLELLMPILAAIEVVVRIKKKISPTNFILIINNHIMMKNIVF